MHDGGHRFPTGATKPRKPSWRLQPISSPSDHRRMSPFVRSPPRPESTTRLFIVISGPSRTSSRPSSNKVRVTTATGLSKSAIRLKPFEPDSSLEAKRIPPPPPWRACRARRLSPRQRRTSVPRDGAAHRPARWGNCRYRRQTPSLGQGDRRQRLCPHGRLVHPRRLARVGVGALGSRTSANCVARSPISSRSSSLTQAVLSFP